jgi:hypothetical protein
LGGDGNWQDEQCEYGNGDLALARQVVPLSDCLREVHVEFLL